jgi:predicted RNA-binding protein YlxR (DUF448 family)
VLDASGKAPGRGAYLHAQQGCVELARKRRALERALRATVEEELWAALGRLINSP